MSEAKGVERSVEGLAWRLFAVNLASIHSTTLASVDIPPSGFLYDAVLIIQYQ